MKMAMKVICDTKEEFEFMRQAELGDIRNLVERFKSRANVSYEYNGKIHVKKMVLGNNLKE